MTYSFELVLVGLVLTTAFGAILVKDLISAVFILGSYSFFLALVWAWLGAVDLAFVEAVVGAGLGTVFLLLTLSQARAKDTEIRHTPPPRAIFPALIVVAALLLYAATDLPAFGDADSIASLYIAPTYVENSLAETRTPNVVTSIIMDYRGFDTLIETCVIFAAGIASAAVVRRH
jgi:multicomponent Na+:H+ antiporter subunit B